MYHIKTKLLLLKSDSDFRYYCERVVFSCWFDILFISPMSLQCYKCLTIPVGLVQLIKNTQLNTKAV